MRAWVLQGERRGRLDIADPARAPASTVWANPRAGDAEVPEPELAGPHDVIVRVAACGICGSDLHCAEPGPGGFVSFGGPARLPVVLGHEFTGTVVRAGRAVSNVHAGDLIAAESIWACWACDDCDAGHLNDCRTAELVGLTVNGALAPLLRLDGRHCHTLQPVIDSRGMAVAREVGALLEPLGVGDRALRRAQLRPDDRVVVVGSGPIGLGVVLLARAAGVRRIVACDLVAERAAMAEALGAEAVHVTTPGDAGAQIAAAMRRAFGAAGATLAVEAGGSAAAFDTAFSALASRGRLLVLGRMPDRVPVDTNALLTKSLTVIGSRGHAGGGIFRSLIARLADRVLDPQPLITARFPASHVSDAFAHARQGTGGKTLVQFES